MILVDTSVWVSYFRSGDPLLADLLEQGEVLVHPWIIGELLLGNLQPGGEVHLLLRNLQSVSPAADTEVLFLVANAGLAGTGIGYVDAQLLASVRLVEGAGLWSRDQKLTRVAEQLGVAFTPS